MRTQERLSPHPFAKIFPAMDQREFQKLKDDIAANGQLEPIVTYQGQILDGWHRYRACIELGIEPRFREYTGGDPLKFVIGANLRRRHLNESGRAMSAARLADLKRGGDRSKAQICALTHAQAAQLFNVSERQVDHASALLNAQAEGRVVPEVVEAVHDGRIRLHKAMKIAELSLKEQTEIVSRKNKGTVHPDRGRNREPWARRLEKTASEAQQLSLQIGQFIARDEIVGKLTPEHRKRLVQGWRCAAQRLSDAAKRLEQIDPQGADPKPVEEDAAERLDEMAPQAGATPVVEDEVDLD